MSDKGNGNKVSKTVTLTTNTEKGKEAVRITAFVEKDPNAQAKATGGPVIQTSSAQ